MAGSSSSEVPDSAGTSSLGAGWHLRNDPRCSSCDLASESSADAGGNQGFGEVMSPRGMGKVISRASESFTEEVGKASKAINRASQSLGDAVLSPISAALSKAAPSPAPAAPPPVAAPPVTAPPVALPGFRAPQRALPRYTAISHPRGVVEA